MRSAIFCNGCTVLRQVYSESDSSRDGGRRMTCGADTVPTAHARYRNHGEFQFGRNTCGHRATFRAAFGLLSERRAHLLRRLTTVAFGELGPREAGAWQLRLLVAGATPNRLYLPETSLLPVDTLVDESGEARIG